MRDGSNGIGRWFLGAFILAVLCWIPEVGSAQEDESTAPDGTVTGEGDQTDGEGQDNGEEGFDDDEESGGLLGGETTDLEAIEDLLAQDESTRSDVEAFTYDPGTRRDPFRSLLLARNSRLEEAKERPEGKAGLLIDEIVVEGVFQLADGPVVQIQSAHQDTSFLLRPGDQLWDGDVISITLEEVVFKQLVDDPTALKPFREVVKRLNP